MAHYLQPAPNYSLLIQMFGGLTKTAEADVPAGPPTTMMMSMAPVPPPHPHQQGQQPAFIIDPHMTAKRRAIEDIISRTMDSTFFTLKCKVYRQELKELVASSVDTKSRAPIPYLIDPPQLKLNSYEAKIWKSILEHVTVPLTSRPHADLVSLINEVDLTNRSDKAAASPLLGRVLLEQFHELLNSLSNRLLFLVLVEYRSWFPQNPARQQMVQIVTDALWPNNPADPVRVASARYVELFVVQRTRNFRDVISRVCKREKSSSSEDGASDEVDSAPASQL